MKKYYVSMTDKFMSNWGMSEGKTNKYIVECETFEQAETIERNANKRSDMKYINISSNKPYYNKRDYLISLVSYSDLGEIWKK
jgi:hypothetical protein